MRRIRKRNTLEPGLCTSALGVGEGVLGGAEQGGVKDFVGFEIHTRFHDF